MHGKLSIFVSLVLGLTGIGCIAQSDPVTPDSRDVIYLVPGVAGPTWEYEQLITGLHDGGIDAPVQVVTWGAPPPLFVLNFQTQSIHDAAEEKLARLIAERHATHPGGAIGLVGHSAGCGVILGALGRLQQGHSVDRVILLASAVSPGYELAPALAHVRGPINVFYSDRDIVFLSWRASAFGTYDSVRTKASGHTGFDLADLDPQLRRRIAQRGYDESWRSLGNDGGHWGALARRFSADILAPLLVVPEVLSTPATARSSVANQR